MTSDQDKFVKVATQELDQLHSTSSGLAADVVVLLMIVAIVIGVFLAIWICRGGLSRYSFSTLSMRPSVEDLED
jgi:high-affinity Fe2+/Pb2+ permease